MGTAFTWLQILRKCLSFIGKLLIPLVLPASKDLRSTYIKGSNAAQGLVRTSKKGGIACVGCGPSRGSVRSQGQEMQLVWVQLARSTPKLQQPHWTVSSVLSFPLGITQEAGDPLPLILTLPSSLPHTPFLLPALDLNTFCGANLVSLWSS